MSARRSHGSTSLGLILLAAALGLSLFSFAVGALWSTALSMIRLSAATVASVHSLWIPLSAAAVDAGVALLGFLGFLFLWRGRWGLGSEHASRLGLAMLSALVAGVSYALYAITGILLGVVAGAAFLVPFHGLLAVIGGVFVGIALYGVLAHLPIPGARPVAAVAFALGVAGIALLNFAAFDLRRGRVAGLDAAGLGLALASLTLWLVLCLWGEETIRSRSRTGTSAAASQGS